LITPPPVQLIELGDPRPQVLFSERAITTTVGDGIVILGERVIKIPALRSAPTPELRRLVWELRARTDWSARQIARVLGTSHTTINRIEAGGRLMSGHSGDLRRRLGSAHDVVSRVHVLAGGDADATARALETAGPSGDSAVALMQADAPARAYLAALDVLNPRQDGLLVGTRPRSGDAPAPLHE
jgi:transcriptional regulator with XRE-family HTH domain